MLSKSRRRSLCWLLSLLLITAPLSSVIACTTHAQSAVESSLSVSAIMDCDAMAATAMDRETECQCPSAVLVLPVENARMDPTDSPRIPVTEPASPAIAAITAPPFRPPIAL